MPNAPLLGVDAQSRPIPTRLPVWAVGREIVGTVSVPFPGTLVGQMLVVIKNVGTTLLYIREVPPAGAANSYEIRPGEKEDLLISNAAQVNVISSAPGGIYCYRVHAYETRAL